MRLDPAQIDVMDDAMAEVLRRKTGAERLQIASGMYSFARELVISSIRARHPEWNDDQVLREAAGRLSHGAV